MKKKVLTKKKASKEVILKPKSMKKPVAKKGKKMDKYEIVVKHTRSPLIEGRSYQMGFGFLKHLGGGKFETVSPCSPCKDYMNDVVWSEHIGKHITCYGLSYSKQDILDGKTSYMLMAICPSYGQFETDKKKLKENYKNVEKFMQFFDKKFGHKVMTEIIEVEDNKYLVKFDYQWSATVVAISLYTLLMRAGQHYDGTTDVMKFMESDKMLYIDMSLLKPSIPKIKQFIEAGSLPKQDLASMSGYGVHNNGIVAYKG